MEATEINRLTSCDNRTVRASCSAPTGPTPDPGLCFELWRKDVVRFNASFARHNNRGHEFSDVFEKASADKAYRRGGSDPTTANEGSIADYERRRGASDAVMKAFDTDELAMLNQLEREFTMCDHTCSSFPDRFKAR